MACPWLGHHSGNCWIRLDERKPIWFIDTLGNGWMPLWLQACLNFSHKPWRVAWTSVHSSSCCSPDVMRQSSQHRSPVKPVYAVVPPAFAIFSAALLLFIRLGICCRVIGAGTALQHSCWAVHEHGHLLILGGVTVLILGIGSFIWAGSRFFDLAGSRCKLWVSSFPPQHS